MLPFYGVSIICLDDKNLKFLSKKINSRNIVTYSIKSKKADVYIYDIVKKMHQTSFKLKVNTLKILKHKKNLNLQ